MSPCPFSATITIPPWAPPWVLVYQWQKSHRLPIIFSIWTFHGILRRNTVPVGGGCRIYRLHLCKVVRLLQRFLGYDTKKSDGEAPVILYLSGMLCIPLLPSLPGPLWPGVVSHDRALFISQVELNCVFLLNWIVGNRAILTFKLCNYAKLYFLNKTVYMYKNGFDIV